MTIIGMGANAITVNLLCSESNVENQKCMKTIQLDKIVTGNYQPRKVGSIRRESIQDLVESIKEHGVLQPIIVRELENGIYELIAGERRYRSAFEANLNEIPCIVKNVSEKDGFAIALIENIQREQLSLLEESESLLKLKEEYFLSVYEVSKMVSKPRTTVANLIRVASLLSTEGKLLWGNSSVDYGHIRAVIMLDHELQNIVLKYVVKNKLSVRETEKFISDKKYFCLSNNISIEKINSTPFITSDELKYLSKKFAFACGKDVFVKTTESGKIRVLIEFEDLKKAREYIQERENQNL